MDWSGTFSIPESKSLVYISRMRNVTVLVYFALLTKSFYSLIIYRSSQKETLHVFKSIFWRNVIEILQNFERVLWNHILVNISNFKSIDAKLKKLCWDQLRKVDNYTREKWKFWRQKMISNFLFRSSFIWLQESCDKMIS